MTRLKNILAYALILLLVPVISYSARDGSGGYSLPSNAFSNPVSGGTLTASDATAVWSDLETAIAGSVAADGQTTMSGDLKMGANQLVNVGAGSARTDGLNLGQAQDSAMRWGGIAGGTGNALTLSVTPAITAYADGQTFWFISSAANTGAATVNINSVGADTIVTRNGDALVSGDIEASAVYAITYYNSNFYLWSPAPQLSLYAALASANTFTAAQTISGTAAGTLLTLESSEAGASQGPDVNLYRNSASPAASDVIGGVNYEGEDSAGNKDAYARAIGVIVDPTSTSEDADLRIQTVNAGTMATRVTIGQGVTVGSATGGDPGAGKVNATGYKINGAELTNAVAQVVRDTDATEQTAGTIMPVDDTVPQNTEGDEILSIAITPVSATSTLLIDVDVPVTITAASGVFACAVFVDSTAGAIAARAGTVVTTDKPETMRFTHSLSAGSTSARTYKVRCGSATAADLNVNGEASNGLFGGVQSASLTVTEILP